MRPSRGRSPIRRSPARIEPRHWETSIPSKTIVEHASGDRGALAQLAEPNGPGPFAKRRCCLRPIHAQTSRNPLTQPRGLTPPERPQTRMVASVRARSSTSALTASAALQAGGHRFDPGTLHSEDAASPWSSRNPRARSRRPEERWRPKKLEISVNVSPSLVWRRARRIAPRLGCPSSFRNTADRCERCASGSIRRRSSSPSTGRIGARKRPTQ